MKQLKAAIIQFYKDAHLYRWVFKRFFCNEAMTGIILIF